MVERFIEQLTAQGHDVRLEGTERTSMIYVDGTLYGHVRGDRLYAI